MASSYSPSLRLELIGTGEQSGTWGNTTNVNLGDLLEQAITGVQAITMLDANYTLTALNGSSDESRNAVIEMTSLVALSATRNVIIPEENKLYTVKNSTLGGQSIVVKTSAGVGYTVPNGKTVSIYCDGTDCFQSSDYFNDVTLAGTPVAPTAAYGTDTTQIATTAFVQAALEAVYPVGSVYINAGSSTNPATLLGFGTWVAFGAGKVMVGLDAGDASFDTLEETGGSKDAINVAHTHTASTASDGAHTHPVTDPGHLHGTNIVLYGSGQGFAGSPSSWQEYVGNTASATTGISIDSAGAHTHAVTVNSAGSSGTNANLQPYVVVQMWKRTA